jgi:hypothetical protein
MAGKHTWQPITITVRDDAQGAVTRLIGEQLQRQLDFLEQASASSGTSYKFVTRMEMLDGGNGAATPVILETWELYGCYLESVNYNEMSYSENTDMRIAMTVKYDNAVQKPQGSGVGSTIARTLGALATG